jgi:hypothetical protein
MGSAASNLSSTDLQTYQSSISEVFQSIQNEASNLTTQQVNLSQDINVIVGTTPPPQNPCNDRRVDVLQACDKSNCRDKEDIYQCQLKKTDATGPTTVSLCNEAFGYTYEQALDKEGFCNGGKGSTTVPESDLYTICQNKLLRQTCDANPPGSYISWTEESCLSNADCTVGTTCDLNPASKKFKFCGVETPPGSFESTCGGDCGTKTIYQIQYIGQDGKMKFTLDPTITRNDIVGIDRCLFEPPSKEGERCYRAYDLNEYYDCVKVQEERKTPPNCAADCKSLYSCTPEELEAFKPVQAELNVIGGSICLKNKASSTFVSKQVAEATTLAILESAITNQFQNDITKKITQTNKGINFNQQNNSQERTSITQKVRNTISQAISSASSNQTVQGDATKQVINFTIPSGKVTISKDCGKESGCITSIPNPILGEFCPGGGLVISNDAISDMDSTQTSRSVVDALLNSGILNDLKNKYSFTAEQKNENDLLGGLIGLLWSFAGLILVFAFIGVVMIWRFGKTVLEVLKAFMIPMIVVAVLAALIWGIVAGVFAAQGSSIGDAVAWKQTTTTTISNPSGQPPSPLPSDPSQPGKNEIECKIGNTAGCNCSIFVTEEEGKTEEQMCSTIIGNLRTNLTSTISEQCNSIIKKKVQWGSQEFSSTFCVETSGEACSERNYTSSEGIRAYCKPVAGLAPIPTRTPSPTLPPA